MSRQQELGMNGRRLFRSAFINIDDEDHPLYVLYKKYKKEFPKGDPLICACEKNRIEDVENMIQILLETNNKNVISNEGKTSRGVSFTPLGIAARKGYLNIVQLLFENGVDSSICSKRDKWNVLHIAAYYSKTSSNVVKYLLKHLPKKVINQKDIGGETPLDNAYSNPYRVKDEIVKCMIKYGALSATDEDEQWKHFYARNNKTKKGTDRKKKEEDEKKRKKVKRKKMKTNFTHPEYNKVLNEKKLRIWKRRLRERHVDLKRFTDADILAMIELNDRNKKEEDYYKRKKEKRRKRKVLKMKELRIWKRRLRGHKVNLSRKGLTDVDVLAISEFLKTNRRLKKLDLSDNNITDIQSIGEALKTNNTLTVLILSNNNITDDSGIQSIIDVLKRKKRFNVFHTLKRLDLRNNQLSDNMKSQLNDIDFVLVQN